MSDVPDGPLARHKGHGLVRALGWELRDDGWWLQYLHAELVVTRPDHDAVVTELRWLPAAEVEPLPGVDYRGVPRRDGRTT